MTGRLEEPIIGGISKDSLMEFQGLMALNF